jgi:hypothetical protein
MQLAIPVAPYVNEILGNNDCRYQSKNRSLRLLAMDLRCIENNAYYDWKLIHFQVAASLASLMLVYADGATLDQILN